MIIFNIQVFEAADQLSIYLDTLNFTKASVIPSIAQLVERRTVVVRL